MTAATRLFTACAFAVAVALATALPQTSARAEGKGPADAQAIRKVIQTQLNAFRRDDAASAFRMAAPSIQRRYRTPKFFLSIVRRHYAPVYRARVATFGRLAMWRGSLTQEVSILAADGRRYTALYPMQKQPDGSWRIAGCAIRKDSSI